MGRQSERGEADNAAREIIRLMDADTRCREADKKAVDENVSLVHDEVLSKKEKI